MVNGESQIASRNLANRKKGGVGTILYSLLTIRGLRDASL